MLFFYVSILFFFCVSKFITFYFCKELKVFYLTVFEKLIQNV